MEVKTFKDIEKESETINKEMENLGFISMDCPNGCDGGYLIPYNNPNLQKL